MASVAGSDIEIYPLSLERYERMVEAGILDPEDRVELLRGVLAAVTPQGVAHAAAIEWLTGVLVRGTEPEDARVRVQLPLRLPAAESAPEPDVAVVAATSPRSGHPEMALLIVEVGDTSAARDLAEKAAIYAEAGIPEYWAVGVRDRAVTVHRTPSAGRYTEIHMLRSGMVVAGDARVPPVDVDALLAQLRTA